MTFGLTPTGFNAKTLADLLTEIKADQLAKISPTLDVSDTSFVGVFDAIMADRFAELWQVAQACYTSGDPAQAEDFALDAICAITGTERERALRSKVKGVHLTLEAGKTVPAGSIVAVAGDPDARFTTDTAVTSTIAGTYHVDCTAELPGPTVANAGTLTVIVTPVTGWTAVTNPTDAIVGTAIETNTALRQRRIDELAARGSSTTDGIRSAVLQYEATDGSRPIAQCDIFENRTDVTDALGLPPHSIEVLIFESAAVANDIVAQTIFDAMGAGIGTYGSASGTALDTEGNAHVIKFSRPVSRAVYLRAEITVTSAFVADGDSLVQAAIVAYGRTNYRAGVDVVTSALYVPCFTVAGVSRVGAIKAAFSASPTSTADLAIGPREIAVLDTSRITVVHV